MHVARSSKENEIQAKGWKMWRAQLHSKQPHELMLCPFFPCLWCWSSHFNCTGLVLLLVNLMGRPLINFDCAKKLLQILTWLFRTMRQFCTFTLWWNPKLLRGGRKQNQGCVALAFCSQEQEELHPHFPSVVLFPLFTKMPKGDKQWSKKDQWEYKRKEQRKDGVEGCTELKQHHKILEGFRL